MFNQNGDRGGGQQNCDQAALKLIAQIVSVAWKLGNCRARVALSRFSGQMPETVGHSLPLSFGRIYRGHYLAYRAEKQAHQVFRAPRGWIHQDFARLETGCHALLNGECPEALDGVAFSGRNWVL